MPLTDAQRAALRDELHIDPEGLYAGLTTDQEFFDALTAVNRPGDVDEIETWRLYAALQADGTELAAFIASSDWDEFKAVLSLGTISVKDTGIRQRISTMFPNGTYPNIRSALIALQQKQVTRLTDLGLPVPTLHQIAVARS